MQSLTDEQLAALGVDADSLGVSSAIPRPPVDSAAGANLGTSIPLLWLLTMQPGAPRLGDVRAPAADDARVSVAVSADGRYAAVSMGDGEQPDVRGVGGLDRDAFAFDDLDPSTVALDLERAGTVAIIRRDGSGVVIARDSLTSVRSASIIAPLAEIRSPAAAWVSDVRDPWVQSLVIERASHVNSWDQLVAAGLVSRFTASRGASEAREIIAAVIEQRAHPAVAIASRTDRWFASLSGPERETAEDLAVAEVQVLSDALEALREDWNDHDVIMRDALRRMCHERDDIEAVRMMMPADRRAALGHAMDPLDTLGRLWAEELGGTVDLDDERLRRARDVDLSAWWGAIACGAIPAL